MKVEIKSIDSADLADKDIPTWQPACVEDVYLEFTLSIGPCDEKGSDYFNIVVATPEAIKERQQRPKWKDTTNRKRPIKRRQHAKLLVIQEYNWQAIKEALERMVRECEGFTWEQTVSCLRKRFNWEYEGMAGS
ncbi:MAG TPA: Imm8 family immunity protein [Gemmata sp.]|nr:Imm8 family immunity protein [Gemmata sp.]